MACLPGSYDYKLLRGSFNLWPSLMLRRIFTGHSCDLSPRVSCRLMKIEDLIRLQIPRNAFIPATCKLLCVTQIFDDPVGSRVRDDMGFTTGLSGSTSSKRQGAYVENGMMSGRSCLAALICSPKASSGTWISVGIPLGALQGTSLLPFFSSFALAAFEGLAGLAGGSVEELSALVCGPEGQYAKIFLR